MEKIISIEMGRKAVPELCQVCGVQARKINYASSSKGRTYHYSKFVHANGVVHYYRLNAEGSNPKSNILAIRPSLFETLEEIVDVKMRGKEMRFSEIKALLEGSYGKSAGTATIYRNLNKLLRLDLISKRIDGGVVLYQRKTVSSSAREIRTMELSIGFDLTNDKTFVTLFAHFKNLGLGLVTGYTISLPFGGLDSFDQINLSAFDETKKITLSKKNISYSSSDQSGVFITLNRPLHKSEEEHLFLNYSYKVQDGPIKLMITSEVDFLKIHCEVEKEMNVQIKKRLLDGLKEIAPMIVRRTGTELGHTIVEAEFENATRGDTIVISLSK